MSRPASGNDEILIRAREAIASAQTVEQLRQAQAVVLPLDFAMSLADTAQVIGISQGWVCQLRRRFMRGQIAGASDAPTPGGRKRQNMSEEEEREFLAPFFEQAATGGVLVVGKSKWRWTSGWGETWRWPRPTICCTATAGESSHPTSATLKVTQWPSKSGKKLPETLAAIRQDWGQGKDIKLMFQSEKLLAGHPDEARFGRISDVRRCWAPKPLRPICQGMLTHE